MLFCSYDTRSLQSRSSVHGCCYIVYEKKSAQKYKKIEAYRSFKGDGVAEIVVELLLAKCPRRDSDHRCVLPAKSDGAGRRRV